MAYTIQCIIMYATFSATGYDGTVIEQTEQAKSAISALMFLVPPVLILISFVIFSKKYKIYGEFKQTVLDTVAKKHAQQ